LFIKWLNRFLGFILVLQYHIFGIKISFFNKNLTSVFILLIANNTKNSVGY